MHWKPHRYTGVWMAGICIRMGYAYASADGAVLGILAWIGYTLATTPPPKPIEDVEKELENSEEKPESRGGSG